MILKVSPERKDVYIRTLMDNLSRSHEENLFILEEMFKMREQAKRLFQENSLLRHRLQEAGIEIPASVVEEKTPDE